MDTLQELIDRVCDGVSRWQLVPAGGAPAVLMVSGGSDSVALARIIAACSKRLGLAPLRIMHMNHNLRGADSDADEAFVVALGQELKIPVSVFSEDVCALVKQSGRNMEELARELRYRHANALLDDLCNNCGAATGGGRILVAHSCNDRVETFFMRAIVGAGLGALCSMPRKNGRVIRPLLDISRQELRDWLCKAVPDGVRWREDVTNGDETHFRAFVRSRIIPLARQCNPSLSETVCRNLDILADENALLEQMGQKAYDNAVALSTQELRIDMGALAKYALPLQRRALRQALLELLPAGTRLDSSHIEHIVRHGGQPGFATLLPSGLALRNEYGFLVSQNAPSKSAAAQGDGEEDFETVLPIPGEIRLADGSRICAEEMTGCEAAQDKAKWAAGMAGCDNKQAFVDVGEAFELVVCFPKAGMRMQPLGMGGHSRKIFDILADAKVPARLRGQIPLVMKASSTGLEPVWLAGHRLDERSKVGSKTRRVVKLSLA